MVWVVSIGIAIVVLLVFVRPKSVTFGQPADVRAQVQDARARAETLTAEQRRELAEEVRTGALVNYDRNFQIAKDHGKDDTFAHQMGILSAIKSILAPNGRISRYAEDEILTEGVPFNTDDPTSGRVAVAEYLVWKFFPTEANEALFAGPLLRYRDEIIKAAENEDEPDQFMMVMLYSMKFDWMRWIADNRPGA